MESERINIQKENIIWALNKANIGTEAATKQFPFLQNVFDGKKEGTAKQYMSFCKAINVPFPYLLLSNPPSIDNQNVKFRTIENKKNNSISSNLQNLIYDMQYKQDWISDYRLNNDFNKVNFIKKFSNLVFDPVVLAEQVRAMLKLKINWFEDTLIKNNIFRYLREKMEGLGIIVMKGSVLNGNTHRIIELKECRGFVLNDDYAPLIFINSRDDAHANTFTLLHEFIHLLYNDEQDIVDEQTDEESKINKIVSEVLLPSSCFNHQIRKYDSFRKVEISQIANYFNSSLYSVAYKLYLIHKISYDSLQVYKKKGATSSKSKNLKVNYYQVAASKISTSFYLAVSDSLGNRSMNICEGCKLLGIRPKGYVRFEKAMDKRLFK